MDSKCSKLKYLEFILAFGMILAGIILRIKVYLTNLPFWVDEEAVLLDLADIFNGKEPFWSGLKNQYSMPLINIIAFFIYKIFSYNELYLRLIPFFASVLSLPAFAILAKKTIKTPFLFLIPLFFISISNNLLFITQFFKFYSTDFLVFILISIAVFYFNPENLTKKKVIIYSLLALSACCSAISALFYILGICIVLFFYVIQKRQKGYIKKWILFSIPLISYMIFYVHELFSRHVNLEFFSQEWHALGNYFPSSSQDIVELLNYHFSVEFNNFTLISIIICFIFGFTLLVKKFGVKAFLFISPLIMMLIFGALEIFPFIERLTLFLYSFLLILLFNSIDFISWKNFNVKQKIIPVVCSILLFIIFKSYNYTYLNEVWNNENYYKQSTAREFYMYLKKEYKNGDIIFAYGRNSSLRIYDIENRVFDESCRIVDTIKFNDFFDNLPKNHTVHIYFSKINNEEDKNNFKIIEQRANIIKTVNDKDGIYVKFNKK